jgi:phospholipid/cholesterol/gamma-HCH transport system substrate-binding protein
MGSVQSAARNLDESSQQLHQTLTNALGPDANSIDAAGNIRESLSNLNQATGNMAEDTEALKHEFFFRGFFKHRGYYSRTGINPETYRKDKLFTSPGNARVWLTATALFEQKPDGSETLSPAGRKRIDAAIAELGDAFVGLPMVIEGYDSSPDPGGRLATSHHRAIVVRQYLHTHFQLDPQALARSD